MATARRKPGDHLMGNWFYVRDGKHEGPVNTDGLVEMLLNGFLPPHTLVWTQGQRSWSNANSIPELAALLPPPVVPEPHVRAAALPGPKVVTAAVCSQCEATLRRGEMQRRDEAVLCPQCYYSLASRRHVAFTLDVLLTCAVAGAITLLLWTPASGDTQNRGLKEVAANVYFWIIPVFLFKDGFHGVSPGKAIVGLQVVEGDMADPAGLLASLKRNLPLLVPFLPLVAGLQLISGSRIGDGWAGTRVVDRRPNFQLRLSQQALPLRDAKRSYLQRLLLGGAVSVLLPLYIAGVVADQRPASRLMRALGLWSAVPSPTPAPGPALSAPPDPPATPPDKPQGPSTPQP